MGLPAFAIMEQKLMGIVMALAMIKAALFAMLIQPYVSNVTFLLFSVDQDAFAVPEDFIIYKQVCVKTAIPHAIIAQDLNTMIVILVIGRLIYAILKPGLMNAYVSITMSKLTIHVYLLIRLSAPRRAIVLIQMYGNARKFVAMGS